MNGTLVTLKVEETLEIIQNVVVPYIEAKWCKDGNIHAFEIVNTKMGARKHDTEKTGNF
jgi:hypothetical protein